MLDRSQFFQRKTKLSHYRKIPLTYLVPIAVSLYSSAAERRKMH